MKNDNRGGVTHVKNGPKFAYILLHKSLAVNGTLFLLLEYRVDSIFIESAKGNAQTLSAPSRSGQI